MAWVGLVVIFALIVLVIVTGVTGSKYFMPSLALMIIVPILIMWCFGWERFCKITKRIGLENKGWFAILDWMKNERKTQDNTV